MIDLKKLEARFNALLSDPGITHDFAMFLVRSKEGRINTLQNALMRTRAQRDIFKTKYEAEKSRADYYRERLREKRTELYKLKSHDTHKNKGGLR